MSFVEFAVVASERNTRLAEAGVAPGSTIPLELCCEMGHAMFAPVGQHSLGGEILAQLGRKCHVAMTLPLFSGVHAVVAETNLIAMVPHLLARRYAKRCGLCVYRPPVDIPPVEICMVWHNRSTDNPAHRWLRESLNELLTQTMAELDTAEPEVA